MLPAHQGGPKVLPVVQSSGGECYGQCPEAQGYPRQSAVSPGQWGFELLIFGLICKRLNEIEGEKRATLLKASYGAEERAWFCVSV